mgnify:CR=1 FL=1
MANWKNKINISELWNSDIPFTEFRGRLVEIFEQLDIQSESYHEILRDIQSSESVEEFDDYWERMYTWADHNHRLWIQTTKAF